MGDLINIEGADQNLAMESLLGQLWVGYCDLILSDFGSGTGLRKAGIGA